MDPKLLEARNIVAHYGKNQAIKDISLELNAGTVVGLIGANGSGKTTILKLISGLMRPTHGTIWFEGDRIDGLPPHKIVELGIVHVPEGRRLFVKMDVRENLRIGRYLLRDDREMGVILEKVLHYFPILRERIRQSAKSLSGGEQQMLAIARGLMAQPKLLLLDEPTLGLSPLMSLQIGQVISDIHKEGMSILLAEQNARLALKLSHDVYVFETGKLRLHGQANELAADEEIRKAYL